MIDALVTLPASSSPEGLAVLKADDGGLARRITPGMPSTNKWMHKRPRREPALRSIVEQYWTGVAQRLQAEVDVFNELIGHPGEKGRENELSLARLLGNLIPRRLAVGSGVVIDSKGNRSRQSDIIIHDPMDQPTVMSQTNQLLHPVEAVRCVIEIKTTLNEAALADAAEKARSLRELQPISPYPTPYVGLLAYHSDGSPKVTARRFRAIREVDRPDSMCVVTPGLLAGDSALRQGAGSNVALVPLHELDGQGARAPGNWTKVDSPGGALHVQAGTAYPVTRIPKIGNFAGDPGRAILLFCDALLQALADRRALPTPFLSAYIDALGRDVMPLNEDG